MVDRASDGGITRFLHVPTWIAFGILLLPDIRFLFADTGLRWAYILLLSYTLSFSLIPVLSRIARKYNIVDRPNRRKVHTVETPLLGGAAVFVGFLTALLINGIFSIKLEMGKTPYMTI